ncbi:dynein axonemal assembly factor 19-like [Diadema antillarum]|uniref:dynein axonemal assembly factor 19-like n=1 Tax=Diadema antillarum TaxID=105358 RepID=UPI003A83C790
MADLKEDRIDFDKLERELLSAVDADARYWRENDAKLRAVDQRVESYEQFRDIVAAAHIQPLEKKDKFGQGKRSQPWNPFSSSSSSNSSSSSKKEPECPDTASKQVKTLPQNGHEFVKEWRLRKKSSTDACYLYLLEIGGEALAKVFRSEISFGLLGEIVAVLDGGSRADDSRKVADILLHLSRAGRFGLSLDFLSKAERQTLTSLFAKLEHWAIESDNSPPPPLPSPPPLSSSSSGGADEDVISGQDSSDADDAKGEQKPAEETTGSSVQDPPAVARVTRSDISHLRKIYKLEEAS